MQIVHPFSDGAGKVNLERALPGRLWAVRGHPKRTNDDRQHPLHRRSARAQVESGHMERPAHQSLRNKKQEWEEYRSEVTAFELRKMLPVL